MLVSPEGLEDLTKELSHQKDEEKEKDEESHLKCSNVSGLAHPFGCEDPVYSAEMYVFCL
jgi:hypothetical protein